MIEWLIEVLLGLLTKTVLWPMVRSGQEIRMQRESRTALSVHLHNAQIKDPDAVPTPAYFNRRKHHLRVMLGFILGWAALLATMAVFGGLSGAGMALGCLVMIVYGYFHVDVSNMPRKEKAKVRVGV